VKRKDRQLDESLENVEARQRNVVFPETLENEVSGWRRLYSGKRPLSGIQLIGIGSLIVVLLIFIGGILSVFGRSLTEGSGPKFGQLIRIVVAFLFVLLPLGAFFYLMRRSVRHR
jgi:hypothetical protein